MTDTIATHAGVQNVLDATVAAGVAPGYAAAVRQGNTTWFGAAGVSDTDIRAPRRPEQRFRIGSTTKTFTATVLLTLVGEGALGLDDPVESWLPGILDGTGVTIRHLLQQTSGLFNYVLDEKLLADYVGPAFLAHRDDTFTPERLVGIALAHPPLFAPGAGWSYSNTNYILAGMIIERVTGHAYAAEVADRIAGPLGLTSTYVPGDETGIDGPHPRLYSKLMLPGPDAPVHDVTELNPSHGWAAGGMISTLEDLNQFFAALLGGLLLPPDLHREMFTGISTDGGGWIPDTTYGLGVYSQRLPSGTTVWGHGGAIHGSWSYVMGSIGGSHLLAQSINGDWTTLDVFARALDAEFGSLT
ncbi:serine hydrolase domain-containing protein [Rugosimonospora acidiphila]|uniref:Serine hydrolase domain-containing protein n=1 Tax=Rugosimonospora acidiphila TaxID=556531 RepID=A0ABP9RNE1_9ACTN